MTLHRKQNEQMKTNCNRNTALERLKKPSDLDLHCLQKQDISRFSRTRVKTGLYVNPTLAGIFRNISKYNHAV